MVRLFLDTKEGVPRRDTFLLSFESPPSFSIFGPMPMIQSPNVKLFSGPRLLGMAFIGAGLFSIASPYFMQESSGNSLLIGLCFAVFGLIITTTHKGTRVDTDNKRIQAYQAILGYKTGEWNAIPNLEGIYVTNTTDEHSNLPNGISPTLSGKVTDYHVMAISEDMQPVFALNFSDIDKAKKVAKQLGEALAVKVV